MARSAGDSARAAVVREAAAAAEVVVLGTPWGATQAAITSAGSLSGKIVIDAPNPPKPDFSGLALGYTTSAGEQLAQWAVGGDNRRNPFLFRDTVFKLLAAPAVPCRRLVEAAQ